MLGFLGQPETALSLTDDFIESTAHPHLLLPGGQPLGPLELLFTERKLADVSSSTQILSLYMLLEPVISLWLILSFSNRFSVHCLVGAGVVMFWLPSNAFSIRKGLRR